MTAPVSEPVSLSELKIHIRVTHSNEDAYIQSLQVMARQACEDFLRKLIGVQSWQLRGSFPDNNADINISIKPVTAVSSFSYINELGNSQALALATDYRLIVDDIGQAIIRSKLSAWPVTSESATEPVTIQLTAGSNNIREPIKHAIKLLTGHYYENREAITPGALMELPLGVKRLLWPHREPPLQ